jgi:hypothetical protein
MRTLSYEPGKLAPNHPDTRRKREGTDMNEDGSLGNPEHGSMPEPGPDDSPINLPGEEPRGEPETPAMREPGLKAPGSPDAPGEIQDPEGVPGEAPNDDRNEQTSHDEEQ